MARHHLKLVVGGSADSEGADAHRAQASGDGSPGSEAHTLSVFGELSHESAHVLEAEIEQLCEAGIDALTLDLSRLEAIDWSGMRVIAFRHGWCRRRGCELTLVQGPPNVQRIFDREGLSSRLPFLELAAPPSSHPVSVSADARVEGGLFLTPA